MASDTNESPNVESNSFNSKIASIFHKSSRQDKNAYLFNAMPRYEQFELNPIFNVKSSNVNSFDSKIGFISTLRPPIEIRFDVTLKNIASKKLSTLEPLPIDFLKPMERINNDEIFKKCPTLMSETKETYTCFRSQVCCATGCCRMEKFDYSNWIPSVVLLLCFIAMLCICYHYYKKLKIANRRTTNCRRRSFSTSRTMEPRNFAQPNQGMVSEDLLERIVRQYAFQPAHPMIDTYASTGNQGQQPVEINHHQATAPPPSYETLVDTFSNNNEFLNNREEELPPVYLEACRIQSVNERNDGKVEN